MAFQTGSQINPALGRVDYTPYMQGAVAGAQSIGQGLASLGQSVGAGIESYYKKKEQKQQEDQATAFVGNLVKSDPQVAKFLGLQPSETGEYDEKALRAGIKTVGAPAILGLANNFQMMQQEQALRQQQMEGNSFLNQLISQNYDRQTGKVNVGAIYKGAAEKGIPSEGVAKTLETLAKVNETGAGRPVMTLGQAQTEANAMAAASGKDFVGKTLYDEKTGGFTPSIVMKSPAAFASPEEEAAKEASKGLIGRINKQAEEESAYAPNAQQTLEEISATRQALDEGAMVGAGQNAIDSLIGVFARLPGAGEYFEKLKGNQDVLKRSVSSFAIDSAQRIAGQGQITDTERKLVASTVPQNTDSRVGFEFGLGFMQAAVERRQKYAELLEDTQARLSNGELTPSQAAKITNRTKFYKDNPIDVKGIYEMAKNPKKPAPAPAGSGSTPIPKYSPAPDSPSVSGRGVRRYDPITGNLY